MRYRLSIGAAVIAALLIAGYTAWWYILVRRVEIGFAEWSAARRAEGWTVEVGATHFAGWPSAARLDLTDVRVRGGAPFLPLAVAWDAAGLGLEVQPLDPGTLVIIAQGEQRVATQGGEALVLSGGSLSGRIPLTQAGPPWVVDVEARSLHARPPLGAAALIGHMTAHAVLDPAARSAATALGATIAAARIELPHNRPWPLGERIEAIDADLAISGPVPPPENPTARAAAWRAAGGTAVLRSGTLRWGPLDATAAGKGGLDATMQPLAEGTARVTGWAQSLDVLAAHHVIADHAAMTAKAVISLLAETPQGGGPSVLTVPFSARDGVLSVRGIPLLRMPSLAWPDA